MNAEVMKKACNEAYEKAGHNAFFGSGFRAGVKFAEESKFTEAELFLIEFLCNDGVERWPNQIKKIEKLLEKVRKM